MPAAAIKVGCIVLGRGEDERKVREWLGIAAQVPGFIGFAVGRTVFWDALVAWRAGKITREQAVAQIAGRYREFVDLFEQGRQSHVAAALIVDRGIVLLGGLRMQLGMIGLGRMGANMVRRLLKGGHECVVYDMSAKAVAELVSEKAVGSASLAEFTKGLAKPRAVWLMVPAAVVDKTIADLLPHLESRRVPW